MRLSRLARLLLALAALIGAAPAFAVCQTAGSAVTFAPASSYAVRDGQIAQTSGGAGFSCNGTLITLLSGSYARATVNSLNNFKLVAGSDAIPYKLTADAAATAVFAQGGTIDYFNSALVSLLTLLNSGIFAPKVYAVPIAAPNVAAGTYTDTITVNWAWNVCHGVDVLGLCILGETGTGTTTIQVTLVVSKDCRITAAPIDFRSAPLVGQFAAVTQAVGVNCTKNATYTVAFTSGTAGTSRPWRAMSDGLGHTLQYNLYRSDGATIWDETNPLQSATPGTGEVLTSQMQTYQAKINPAQATPPAGHYTDTISVVISF